MIRHAAAALLLAAAGSAPAQITIDFDTLDVGEVVTDQFVLMTVSSTEGNHVTVGGSPSNRYICSGAIGELPNCTEDILIEFDPPVNGLTFEAIQANLVGRTARFRARSGHDGLDTGVLDSTGSPRQLITRFQDVQEIRSLEIFDINDDPAEAGVAWDTFRFTPVPEGGSQFHPIDIHAPPYSGTHDNSTMASNGPEGSCNSIEAFTMDNAMWFRFVPSQTGPISVGVDSGTSFQPIAALYRELPSGDIVELACDGIISPLELTVDAVAGEPLLIHVGDWGTQPDGGTFELTVDAAQNSCPADTNNDGMVTPADYNAWILAFNTDALECDQNNDGQCTPADYNAWILNFNTGC